MFGRVCLSVCFVMVLSCLNTVLSRCIGRNAIKHEVCLAKKINCEV